MLIHENAMLVTLKVKVWSGRKLDLQATEVVEKEYGSKKDGAGRFNKLLVAKESIKRMQSIANEVRVTNNKFTLPWLDDGARLLPAAHYWDWTVEMGAVVDKFNAAVKTIVNEYKDMKEEAKLRLKGLYCEADYPEEEQLTMKFSVSYHRMPVPDSNDFRVKISDDEADIIRDDINKQLNEATSRARNEIWFKLRSMVSHIYEITKIPRKKFKNSSFDNLAEFCDLVPGLNITEEAKLIEINDKIITNLAGVDPDTMRHNLDERENVSIKAQMILEEIDVARYGEN